MYFHRPWQDNLAIILVAQCFEIQKFGELAFSRETNLRKTLIANNINSMSVSAVP